MATYRIATTSTTPNAATFDYASAEMTMAPDDYGTLIITHSGSRLASSSTVRYFLQGSMDGGTTWFDIEICSPADTLYLNGNQASWCKVVPLAPLVRLRALNANSPAITATAWIID
jgi:hypothetical protein